MAASIEAHVIGNGIPAIASHYIACILENEYCGRSNLEKKYKTLPEFLEILQTQGLSVLTVKDIKHVWNSIRSKIFVVNRQHDLQSLPRKPKKEDYVSHIVQFFFNGDYSRVPHAATMNELKQLLEDVNYYGTLPATTEGYHSPATTRAHNMPLDPGGAVASGVGGGSSSSSRKRKHSQIKRQRATPMDISDDTARIAAAVSTTAAAAVRSPMLNGRYSSNSLYQQQQQGEEEEELLKQLSQQNHWQNREDLLQEQHGLLRQFQQQQQEQQRRQNHNNDNLGWNYDSNNMHNIHNMLSNNAHGQFPYGSGSRNGGWHNFSSRNTTHGANGWNSNSNSNSNSNTDFLGSAAHHYLSEMNSAFESSTRNMATTATGASNRNSTDINSTSSNRRVRVKADPDGPQAAHKKKADDDDVEGITPRNDIERNISGQLMQMGFTDIREILVAIRSSESATSADEIMIKIISTREEAEEARKLDEARILSEQSQKEQERILQQRQAEEFEELLLSSTVDEWKTNAKMFRDSWILSHFDYNGKSTNDDDDDEDDSENNYHDLNFCTCWKEMLGSDDGGISSNSGNKKKSSGVSSCASNKGFKMAFVRLLKLEKKAYQWYESLPKSYFEQVVCKKSLCCYHLHSRCCRRKNTRPARDSVLVEKQEKRTEEEEDNCSCSDKESVVSIPEMEQKITNLSDQIQDALYSLSEQQGGVPRIFLQYQQREENTKSNKKSCDDSDDDEVLVIEDYSPPTTTNARNSNRRSSSTNSSNGRNIRAEATSAAASNGNNDHEIIEILE